MKIEIYEEKKNPLYVTCPWRFIADGVLMPHCYMTKKNITDMLNDIVPDADITFINEDDINNEMSLKKFEKKVDEILKALPEEFHAHIYRYVYNSVEDVDNKENFIQTLESTVQFIAKPFNNFMNNNVITEKEN